MTSYRLTHYRVCDASGNERTSQVPIYMWWLASAAAEETLQGGPMVPAFLKLFRTHLSDSDHRWLRWRGDMAESAEMRRAYSGLYGRYFARALMTHHLGFSRFLSLTRNGLAFRPPWPIVFRTSKGDIPDWIAWDELNRRFALCEAKGSLTATDFLDPGCPKCVEGGKSQFDRVDMFCPPFLRIQPARWVAATRWATDKREGGPVTVLWDPPVDGESFSGPEATMFRELMTRAWLRSIAPRMGWNDDEDLLNPDRGREALVIRAKPGPIPESEDWPPDEDEPDYLDRQMPIADTHAEYADASDRFLEESVGELRNLEIYSDPSVLTPPKGEDAAHEGAYIAVLVSGMGIRGIGTAEDLNALRRAQEAAHDRKEPAMLLGLPLGLDPAAPSKGTAWLDDAGIVPRGQLAVFDLRRIDFTPNEPSAWESR